MITQTQSWSCKTIEYSEIMLDTEDGRLRAEYEILELSHRENFYFVLIHIGGECELAALGNDKTRALKIFKILTQNTVTPCTLSDCINEIKILI